MRMPHARWCRRCAAVGLAFLPVLAVHAQAPGAPPGPAPAGAWYVGANGGIVATDRHWNNDGTAWTAQVGYSFNARDSLELEFYADELDFDIDYGLEHQGVSLNYRVSNRQPLWDPYFLAGVGAQRFEAPEGQPIESGTDAIAFLGIGGEWELLPPRKLLLRSELRFRYDFNDTDQPGQEGFGDAIFTLGLMLPFGR